jgi:hypothetical protein
MQIGFEEPASRQDKSVSYCCRSRSVTHTMSALFGSLPPETAQKRVQDPAEATAPPNKRAKLDSAEPQNTSVKEPQLVGQDHVAAALIKITTHISSGRKFTKASELLRKLVADQNIGQEHSKLVFEVVLCPPVHSLSCSPGCTFTAFLLQTVAHLHQRL